MKLIGYDFFRRYFVKILAILVFVTTLLDWCLIFSKDSYLYVIDVTPDIDNEVIFGDDILEPCSIAEWNNVTTSSIIFGDLHRKWASTNIGNHANLLDAKLRPISAFVYENEIVVTTTAQNRYGKKVYCRYYDCNRQELNGTAWQTIMFPLSAAYCIRQAGAVYMLLTDSPDESPLFDPVPLTLRIDKNYKHEISVCVGPVYGEERRWLEIVETTEHHLLMGINHFYYTILNKMNEYTRKIVDEYERLGYFDVTVIQNEYDTMDWMSHLLQIYDCHFRSRYHSKWVLNIDIDERLVMLKMPILPFLRKIEPEFGEIVIADKRVIRTEQLPETFTGTRNLTKEFQFLKYKWTLRKTWEAAKTIYRPEKVDAAFYHGSYVQYPGVLTKYINTTEAYIRHYRTAGRSLKSWWYKKMQFSASQINEKFEHKLTQKVTNRLESVYNQRPIRCEEMASVLLGLFDNDNYNCVFENGKLYKNVGYVKKHKV